MEEYNELKQPACNELCLLCLLESSDRHSLAEKTNVCNGSIQDVLFKHFWFAEAAYEGRYICSACWDMLYPFHKFYIEIERLHATKLPATIKREQHSTGQDEELAVTLSDGTEQLELLQDANGFITSLNEVFVKECFSDSEDDGHAETIDCESDDDEGDTGSDADSDVPLSELRKATTDDGQERSTRKGTSALFDGIGLSLCRIIENKLQIVCHECFLQSKKSADKAVDIDELLRDATYFTFAQLMKHYRREHKTAGYAVCCSRKYSRRRTLKIHVRSHGKRVVHRCLPCGIKFRKQESLNDHNLLMHTAEEAKQYRCDKCTKAFATEDLLNSHHAWHENVERKKIVCNVCNVFFASFPSLEKHRMLHHPEPDGTEGTVQSLSTPVPNGTSDPTDDKLTESHYRTRVSAEEISAQDEFIKRYCVLSCTQCEYIADTFAQLRQHGTEAHELRACEVFCCDRTYSKRQSLYDHCLVHENPDCFRCSVCGKQYSSSRSLQAHKTRIHTPAAERPFCCEVCGETFVKSYLLMQHMVHHLAKQKKLNYCNECQRSFTTARVLKSHQQTYHGASFSWICDVCAKGFNSRPLFENHRLTHSVEGKTQLKHQCEECHKWLRNKKSYQQHRIRCHANNGPVKCQFCGKESVNASALQSHIHLHHAERPEYPCKHCKKSFKTSLRLREHEATHTGTVLYRCPWCPRTFACGSNMYKHKKAGHPVEWAASVNKRFGER
uniref:C2H2-type domain-containing protein n=1 Tax=Anopheles farauti TaxID=69004 RepID=A0A182QCT7_9DIPT